MPLACNAEVGKGVNNNEIPRFWICDKRHQKKGAAYFLDKSSLNNASLWICLGEVNVVRQGVHTNVVLRNS